MKSIPHLVPVDAGAELRATLSAERAGGAFCYVLGSGAFQTDRDRTAFVDDIVALHASAREPPACLVLCLGASDRKVALGGTTRITTDQARELLSSLAEDAGLFGSWWRDTFAQIERWALFRPGDDLEIVLVQDRVDRRPLDWGDDCREGLDNLKARRAKLPAKPKIRFRLVGAGDPHAAFTSADPRDITSMSGLFVELRSRQMEAAPQAVYRLHVSRTGGPIFTEENVTCNTPWERLVLGDDAVLFTRSVDAVAASGEEPVGVFRGFECSQLDFRSG